MFSIDMYTLFLIPANLINTTTKKCDCFNDNTASAGVELNHGGPAMGCSSLLLQTVLITAVQLGGGNLHFHLLINNLMIMIVFLAQNVSPVGVSEFMQFLEH